MSDRTEHLLVEELERLRAEAIEARAELNRARDLAAALEREVERRDDVLRALTPLLPGGPRSRPFVGAWLTEHGWEPDTSHDALTQAEQDGRDVVRWAS